MATPLKITKIIKEYKDADEIEVEDGTIFTVRHHDGFISYCSRPELLPDYKANGQLTTRFYQHLYGHTDYFFV